MNKATKFALHSHSSLLQFQACTLLVSCRSPFRELRQFVYTRFFLLQYKGGGVKSVCNQRIERETAKSKFNATNIGHWLAYVKALWRKSNKCKFLPWP